ncbi:MAG: Asp-tRNA(Asn)/Glu-tRNA(Gln) amidotransferase subunit GatC [Patescibacteria group bacterium]|jgi:aspartyl-tRNA(Asn)/glutamyl-tRNA(Gln) amidotransferase subunit C
MTFTLQDIERLAKLARLELTPEEREKYREQLTSIVDYIDRIQTVRVPKESPDFHIENAVLEPRPDHVVEYSDTESLVRSASKTQDSFIRVQSVHE